MKCAKSVKVKYRARASRSVGTGVFPACRCASCATASGDAEPMWCTCSSALGRPATNAVRSAAGASVIGLAPIEAAGTCGTMWPVGSVAGMGAAVGHLEEAVEREHQESRGDQPDHGHADGRAVEHQQDPVE